MGWTESTTTGSMLPLILSKMSNSNITNKLLVRYFISFCSSSFYSDASRTSAHSCTNTFLRVRIKYHPLGQAARKLFFLSLPGNGEHGPHRPSNPLAARRRVCDLSSLPSPYLFFTLLYLLTRNGSHAPTSSLALSLLVVLTCPLPLGLAYLTVTNKGSDHKPSIETVRGSSVPLATSRPTRTFHVIL